MKKTKISKKEIFTLFLISWILFALYKMADLEFTQVSSLPSISSEKDYFCLPISIKVPFGAPFQIESIRINGFDLENNPYGMVALVYDCSNPSLGVGSGYTTINEWESFYQDSLNKPYDLITNTSHIALFLFIPSHIVSNHGFTISTDYRWFGFFHKTTTLKIKEVI